jgi:hypothetical protein
VKIFINIASYRDPLLQKTVTEAYNSAKYKDSLVFGIVDQSYNKETINLDILPFSNQIRYLRIDPEYARGACWARHLSQTYYNGEDYYLQIDSHTLFDQDWDETLIEQYADLKQYHTKPVLTAYPHVFTMDGTDYTKLTKKRYHGFIVIMAHPKFHNNGAEAFLNATSMVVNYENSVHGYLLSAGFVFSAGSMVEEVPYDPYIYFSGEEHSLALRLWTHGYNLFHPKQLPLYTYYGNEYRKVVWGDNDLEKNRPVKWWQYDKNSKEHLAKVVSGQDVGKYGMGWARTIEQYRDWTGIDYLTRTVDPKATNGRHIFSQDYRTQPI